MKLVLVGYGRMGRAVDALSAAHGHEIVARISSRIADREEAFAVARRAGAEVAIDFSTADSFVQNFPGIAEQGFQAVVGTTGWQAHEDRLRRVAADAGIGVVAAPNFSIGVVLFQALAERAAQLFAPQHDYEAWIHELHHSAKRDAPSGTALSLQAAMARAGFTRRIDVAASRAGSVPGTHTIGFDGPFDTVTLTHATRDRSTFARGALAAAEWVRGRRGWFSMQDVLSVSSTPLAHISSAGAQ